MCLQMPRLRFAGVILIYRICAEAVTEGSAASTSTNRARDTWKGSLGNEYRKLGKSVIGDLEILADPSGYMVRVEQVELWPSHSTRYIGALSPNALSSLQNGASSLQLIRFLVGVNPQS